MSYFTYQDAQEHGLDYIGGTPDAQAVRDVRRSIVEAYRELTNSRTWTFLSRHGRVITSAPYLAGTVMYDGSGGLYARMLVLSGGTWPDWAGPGSQVRIGVVTAQVAERRSDTILTLTPEVTFPDDIDVQPVHFTGWTQATPTVIAAVAHGLETGDQVVIEGVASTDLLTPVVSINGTWVVTVIAADTFSIAVDSSADTAWNTATGTWRPLPTTPYTLYRDTYVLPEDFVATDTAIMEGNFGGLIYSDPTSALWYERFTQSSGTPRWYTIIGNPLFPGRLTLLLSPHPDLSRTIDFIYHRRPRSLVSPAVVAGTVSTTADSPVVTGNGTNWTARMAGAVLRLGTAAAAPTSDVSTSPAAVETVILEVLSPTMLRVADAMPATTTTPLLYVISDPIDFESGVMLTAFLRGVEKQLTIARTMTDKPDAFASYATALKEAQAADSRSYQGRSMGAPRDRGVPYKYMPAKFF